MVLFWVKIGHDGGAILLPNIVQVTESISGSVVPLAMFIILTALNCTNLTFKMEEDF